MNSKILLNTFFLYIRMFVTMIISLYTSRLVLDVLGVEDFGIYSVVGGIVILLSFLNNTLITTCQRFFSYELGDKSGDIKKILSICIFLVILFSIAVVFISETIGLWYVNDVMSIPMGKEAVANIVYQLSIITIFISSVRTPYLSWLISHENMSIYAIFSILETVLKLLGVLILKYMIFDDKLMLFALFQAISALIITLLYFAYCRRNYSDCRYIRVHDKERFRKVLNFASWNTLGMISDIGVPQGINLLFNSFFGVIINSALSIANQVSAGIYGLVSSFQMAFRPQIVKLYASKEYNNLGLLINRASKMSFCLMMYVAIPLVLYADYILNLWLVDVPQYSISFSQIMIIAFVFESISGPLWMTIQAVGKIKFYQIGLLSLSMLLFPLSYFMLRIGVDIDIVLINRILLSVIILIYQMMYLRKIYSFSFCSFFKNVVLVDMMIASLSLPIPYIISLNYNNFYGLTMTIFLSIILVTTFGYLFGFSKEEKQIILKLIKQLKNNQDEL